MPKINTKKEKSSKMWCKCGYKMRGINHFEGEHHKKNTKEGKDSL